MNMVHFTMKLEPAQVKLLNAIAKKTHVPKSSLVRQGIDLVIKKYEEEIISPELRLLVDNNLREDTELLRKLSKA